MRIPCVCEWVASANEAIPLPSREATRTNGVPVGRDARYATAVRRQRVLHLERVLVYQQQLYAYVQTHMSA